jgi:NTP pyrophosphatase (non-canonical NTP hydrolase)
MTLNELSEFFRKNHFGSSNPALDKIYPLLKLPGEVGELCEKVGKVMRDKGGVPDADDLRLIQKELGDVLFYVDMVSSIYGWTLQEVAQGALAKIQDRVDRGVQRGSGDER